jgi:hypothetical protein
VATDLLNQDPLLGDLADNGGPTMTCALRCGSPAIDHGTNFTGAATDQTGAPRTFDDPNVPNVGDATDIGAFEVQADTTPPSLVCPSNQTVNATGPTGVVTNYLATASDDCVVVTYAIAGTPITWPYRFPIGDTTVNVTATDAATNVTTCSFKVHIEGAVEQISDLITQVDSLLNVNAATRKALIVKLQDALSAAKAGKTAGACGSLTDFISLAKAQKDKKLVPGTIADNLIANATRIKAVLGCK